jgi:peptidoglycan/xylan/chitin deacetylase (PgdA/CDA1 family)
MKKVRMLASGLLLAAIAFMPVSALALGSNLIANPSLETANGATPASWQSDAWGTNTAKFTYENTGHTGNHSVTTTLSNYKTGDAKWFFTPVTVASSSDYTFSDWYKGNVASSIDAVITTTAGKTTYKWMGDLAASTDWKQANFTLKTPANTKNVTFYHYIQANGSLTTDDYNFALTSGTGSDPAPTVALTTPAANATVKGAAQAVKATATDSQGVTSVQFKLDGANLGAPATASPYTTTWDTTKTTNGTHTLSAVATNKAGLTATATETVTVSNPTAPTVAITAPTNGATVSGGQTVTANAADAVSVTSVQFKLDGTDLGAADTQAPYTATWDTTTAVNGSHTLTAVATNKSGLTTTATNVTVTVNNQVVTPPTPPVTPPAGDNLIANPSVETANGALPASWLSDGWGTNTRAFSYENTGHTGNRSVKTTISSYTNGDAKWYFNAVPVTAGQSYAYSDWYKSSVDSEVDAMVTMNDGTVQYFYMGAALASPNNWAQVKAQFTAPAGAKNIVIFQVLAKVGYVQSDDFSFATYTPAQFNRGLVTLTFDDAWRSIYTNGLPLLQKYNLPSTQYLLTQPTIDAYPDYMTLAMMKAFQAQGSEIAAHTVDHQDLTTLTTAQVDKELADSQAQLRAWMGAGVATDFATPYGAYNSNVINEIKKYYRSHRSTDVGYNSKDNFDIYNIKVQNITNTTTPADIQAWVQQAQATKTWLVIVYHEVDPAAEDPTYSVTPANLDSELNIIKQSGVTVETVSQALDEIQAQL